MRIGRASLMAALAAGVALSVAGTASSAGAVRVDGSLADQVLACDPFVFKGRVVTQHCTGTETWVGDITGPATFTFDFTLNVVSGVLIASGTEIVSGACVLGTCGGDLYGTFRDVFQTDGFPTYDPTTHRGTFNFHGGTGPFANAHGSLLFTSFGDGPNTYTDGRIGL